MEQTLLVLTDLCKQKRQVELTQVQPTKNKNSPGKRGLQLYLHQSITMSDKTEAALDDMKARANVILTKDNRSWKKLKLRN